MKFVFTIISDTAESDLEQYLPLIEFCKTQDYDVVVNKFRLPSIYFFSGTEDHSYPLIKAREFFIEKNLDIECDIHVLCTVYQTLSTFLVYLQDTTNLIKNSKKTVFYIQNDSQIDLPNLPLTIQNVKLLSNSSVIQAPYGVRPWFKKQIFPIGLENKLYDISWIGSDSYVMQQGIPGEGLSKVKTRRDFLNEIDSLKGTINFNRLQKNFTVPEYIQILRDSKIVISLLGLGEHCYRLFECLEVGACVIQQQYQYEDMWANPTLDRIVPTFQTPEELVLLVEDLLKDNKYLEVQKKQSEWYQSNYSFEKINIWAEKTINQIINL